MKRLSAVACVLAAVLGTSGVARAEGLAHLTVTDRLGRDVSASVCAVKPDGCAAITARPVPIPGTELLVRISAPGFETLETRLAPGEQSVKLKSKGSVSASFVSTEKNQEWTAEISLARDENGKKGRVLESKKTLLPKAPEAKAIAFEDVPAGDYWLEWEGPQIAAEATRVVVKEPGPVAAGKFEVRGGLTVRGFVRDQSGSPIPEAEIRFMDTAKLAAQQAGWKAGSSAAGEFRVSGLPISKLRWFATAKGFVGASGEWSGEPSMEILLEKAQLVRGRVVDDKKQPVAGARMSLSFRTRESSRSRLAPPTGEDGGFEFHRDVPGELTIRVTAPRYLARDVKVAEAAKEKAAETLDLGDIALSRGRTITGSVVDAKAGHPIDGATIRVAGSEPPVTSTDGGRFTLEPVPESDVVLEASSPGYAVTQAPISKEISETRISLSRGGTVRLRVCGSPEELAETTAVLQKEGGPFLRREGAADLAGNLLFENVSPGRYSLSLQWKIRTPGGSFQGFALGSAGSVAAVQIEDGQTVSRSMRCDGIPVGGRITRTPAASVPLWGVLKNEKGQELGEFRADESGRFLARVASPGRYSIEVAFPRLTARENEFCAVPEGGKLDCQFTAEAR